MSNSKRKEEAEVYEEDEDVSETTTTTPTTTAAAEVPPTSVAAPVKPKAKSGRAKLLDISDILDDVGQMISSKDSNKPPIGELLLNGLAKTIAGVEINKKKDNKKEEETEEGDGDADAKPSASSSSTSAATTVVATEEPKKKKETEAAAKKKKEEKEAEDKKAIAAAAKSWSDHFSSTLKQKVTVIHGNFHGHEIRVPASLMPEGRGQKEAKVKTRFTEEWYIKVYKTMQTDRVSLHVVSHSDVIRLIYPPAKIPFIRFEDFNFIQHAIPHCQYDFAGTVHKVLPPPFIGISIEQFYLFLDCGGYKKIVTSQPQHSYFTSLLKQRIQPVMESLNPSLFYTDKKAKKAKKEKEGDKTDDENDDKTTNTTKKEAEKEAEKETEEKEVAAEKPAPKKKTKKRKPASDGEEKESEEKQKDSKKAKTGVPASVSVSTTAPTAASSSSSTSTSNGVVHSTPPRVEVDLTGSTTYDDLAD